MVRYPVAPRVLVEDREGIEPSKSGLQSDGYAIPHTVCMVLGLGNAPSGPKYEFYRLARLFNELPKLMVLPLRFELRLAWF